MTPNPHLIQIISISVLVYFVLLNGGYLMLNFLAMYALRRRSQASSTRCRHRPWRSERAPGRWQLPV